MRAAARSPTARSRRLRAARLTVLLTFAVGGALLMSACSNSGSSLAQQACVHVGASIRLYTEAEHATSTSEARDKVAKATSQLDQALQLAARANSADPAFNPLMTTLQEIGRTSEANLIPALRAQCAAAQNPTGMSPFPGGSTTGTGSSATASTG
jgi:thioredoxin-like negative regulator of GroEL